MLVQVKHYSIVTYFKNIFFSFVRMCLETSNEVINYCLFFFVNFDISIRFHTLVANVLSLP